MISKVIKYLKPIVIIAIIVAFVWFIAVYPTYKFKTYEGTVKEAAKRYYEINQTKLPTGDRVATVTLQELFTGSYIKEDLYIPYTKSVCSPINSWVKVTKNDKNEYKYYVYLECGALKSMIDHKGPKITLKGEQEMTVEVNENFKDPGISKVYDRKDGNLNLEEVQIKSNVDPKITGDYEIRYTAVDKLGNKTEEVRIVHVINTLTSQIRKTLGQEKRYKGNPENNYIKISNMDFRIVGIDDNNNVMVVAEHPVSYINYNKIDKWLNDYYYKLLSKKTKKMIVSSEYCQATDSASSTRCTKYTSKRNVYYPSIVDVNLASGDTGNFMETDQLSWVNTTASAIQSMGVYRRGFYGEFLKTMDKEDISSIRPMLTIDGKLKIISGQGTKREPYKLKDHKKATGKSKVQDLSIGDIIYNKGTYFLVLDQLSDGTTKVITYSNIENGEYIITNSEEKMIYNPNKNSNIGYKINNKLTKYIDKSVLTSHKIGVPLYKNRIVYGTENSTKKYKVLLSAPNIFELFSTDNYLDGEYIGGSSWFINSSTSNDVGVVADGYGNVDEVISQDDQHGIKVVAYLKKDLYISSGDGSYEKPYTIR